jgi:peptidoglycan-associated lipoprotein
MNRNKLLIVAAGVSLLLAGCSGSDTVPFGDGVGGAGSGFDAGGANSGGSGASTVGIDSGAGGRFRSFDGALPGDLELLEDLVIYFEFDSSEIRADFNDMLAAHGRYLAATPSASVRLEGHADERGSREYNIGLGERRAQAVRQILLLQGATGSQLATVSYGEERPAVFGSDDEAYSLNRRVELNYR